jgi:hypothetical protein
VDNFGLVEVIQGNEDQPEGGSQEVFWQNITLKAVDIITDVDAGRLVEQTWMHSIWPRNLKRVKDEPDVFFTTMDVVGGFQVL